MLDAWRTEVGTDVGARWSTEVGARRAKVGIEVGAGRSREANRGKKSISFFVCIYQRERCI